MSELDAVRKIDEVIVGVGGQATIPFNNIDQRYRHLIVEFMGGTSAVSDQDLHCQFNGDVTANYGDLALYGNVSAGANTVASGTSFRCGEVRASTTIPSASRLMIYNYANTAWNKIVRSEACLIETITAPAGIILVTGALWNSTAAITSILLFPVSGNFVQASVASLYGWL